MKSVARLILYLFLYCLSEKSIAQSCACRELLNALVEKVENNYAGYVHKVKQQDSADYIVLKKELSKKANSTSYIDCYKVLSRYVHFFNDGHLFVIELPRITPLQSDSLRQFIKQVDLTEEKLKQLRNPNNGNPIEGIWKDKNQQLAILKNGVNKFMAITLENTNSKWTRGMVKMEMEETKSNEYAITIYRNDFAPIRFTQVHIYKKSVLPFGVYRFVKISPPNPELNYVDATDPEMPVFKQLDAKSILITVPSALINGNILDSLLQKNEKLLKSTENLIIDVRGNLGGNYIWRNLLALANTKEYDEIKKENENDFLMLASEDNAAYMDGIASYFRQNKDSAGIAYYDMLIGKLKQNTGAFIGFSFYDPPQGNPKRPIFDFPRKIALLVDRGTASAGEAFVMSMKSNSNKTTLYGDRTYGMIDYMNINTRKIPCEGNNSYYYGYPTFFSPSIKTEPINPTGVKPDIYVPAGTTDWIQWVRKHLSNN